MDVNDLLIDPTPLSIQDIIDEDDLAEESKGISLTREADDGTILTAGAVCLQNLIESNLFFIHKQHPVSSFYSTEQLVAANIYLLQTPGVPVNCSAIHRLCFAFTGLKGEGTHNGNGNSIISPFKVKGGRHDYVEMDQIRPYKDFNHDIKEFGYPQYMTLNSRDWDYDPEFFGKLESPEKDNCNLYMAPPICDGCVDVFYPKIGLEGGILAHRDGSNSFYKGKKDFNQFDSRNCSFWGPELFELGSLNRKSGPIPHSKVCHWDPDSKSIEDIPYDEDDDRYYQAALWTKENYRKTWCEPEDIDAYELVSVYSDWTVCGQKAKARMTPIRFHYDDPETGKT